MWLCFESLARNSGHLTSCLCVCVCVLCTCLHVCVCVCVCFIMHCVIMFINGFCLFIYHWFVCGYLHMACFSLINLWSTLSLCNHSISSLLFSLWLVQLQEQLGPNLLVCVTVIALVLTDQLMESILILCQAIC